MGNIAYECCKCHRYIKWDELVRIEHKINSIYFCLGCFITWLEDKSSVVFVWTQNALQQ